MTTKLGTLTVDFLAKTGSFETDVKRARQTLDREGVAMEERAGGLQETLVGVGPAIAAAFVAAAGAVTLGVNNAINRADELSKAASKIGVSIESLSGLSFAAELADVSLTQLQGGITRLIRAQESAASGQGDIAAVFNALGISATDANGQLRATEQVLLELADVFQALPDGPEKSALAIQLFGRSGAQLIPLLNAGSDGIRDLTDEAERLGLVLDTETGRAAEEFNDNITRLRSAWDGLTTSLATGALPTLIKITEALRDVAAAAATTFQREGLIADDFFGQDSGLIAQLFRDRGFEAPGLINTGEGPTLAGVLGGARAQAPIEFITPETIAAGASAGAGAGARDGDAIAESLRKLREEREKGAQAARAASEAERAFAQAQRDAAQAAAEAKRAEDERKAAAADFTSIVEEYRAELNGPLAQAELEWDRRQQQLQQLAERGQITQQQLAEALAVTTELRQRDVQAIEAQISPAQQVIADLEEELRLLQLSNVERQIANAQRFAGVDAFSAEGQAIAEGIRAIDEARERIQFSDDLRRGFEDTFASIIDGTKSAKDAFADLGSYITSLIAQRLGAQLVDSFLGPAGSPIGGGAGGNIFTSFLGSLFGGGRAAGGWVAPGKMYEVAENGPELLRVGNRQFLLPSATGGMVTPNARMGGGGGGVVQNISVQGRIDTRTAAQLARETQRAQSRAAARFGA